MHGVDSVTPLRFANCGRTIGWHCEPTVEDMLSDPVFRLMLACDRVADQDVRDLVIEMNRRLLHRPAPWTAQPLPTAPPPEG